MRVNLTTLGFGASFLVLGCITGRDEVVESPPPAPAPVEAAAPATAPPVADASKPPKTCSGETELAAGGAIDDFEDANGQISAVSGRDGYWFTAKDDKGSVIEPSGDFRVAEGGAGSTKAGNVKGKTASGDGAWGASVGFHFLQSGFYDASNYAGVSFKIKAAKAAPVRVKLPDVNTVPDGGVCSSGCWNSFGKDLTVTAEWQEVRVLFSELRQLDGWGDPRPPALAANKVKGLEWSIDKGQEFDVWIDDIQFIDCK